MYSCNVVSSKASLGNPITGSNSGLLFIAFRNGKHSSSTAYTHAQDFETLLNIEEFQPYVKRAYQNYTYNSQYGEGLERESGENRFLFSIYFKHYN